MRQLKAGGANGSPVRKPPEMGHELVSELGVGRLRVAVGDESLEHLAADVAGASPASPPAGACGHRSGISRRGRALSNALLDAPAEPTLRRRRSHHPRLPRSAARHLPRIAAPPSPLASPRRQESRPPASSLACSGRFAALGALGQSESEARRIGVREDEESS
jgi:hypothetical protein